MERAATIREHLFSLNTLGIKYDLDRMVAAASAIGHPEKNYPAFHVAGTNGKGSVCTYLESCLRAGGRKTGLFVSPHIAHFEERFLINGRPVAEPVWLSAYDSLRPVIDDLKLTFFEATTLMAFEIFKRERIDWAVFETGLGGRLDATNVVIPRVSVIARLAMDHTAYLGNDLLSIAGEKLGIVKNAVPLVMEQPAAPEIRILAEKVCTARQAPLHLVGREMAAETTLDDSGADFAFEGRRYRINLAGEYQVINALLALTALRDAGINDPAANARGMESARLPGRFHIVNARGREMVFDVGHNPDAAESFCRTLERHMFRQAPAIGAKSLCMVLGIMKDKDIAGMLPHYARLAGRLILARPANDRAAATADLRRFVPVDFPGSCIECRDIPQAIDLALDGSEEIVVVAGSFFTVGEAMAHLGIEPYKF
jgi:dihydrofolate synthase/folylpolyglutamate synthase